MLDAKQMSQIALEKLRNDNQIIESKPDSETVTARYVAFVTTMTQRGYMFETNNGGMVFAEVLSTTEPEVGESYLLQRQAGSDVFIVKPKPRL